tara:strand:+ start:793 stop:1590 length:798 start_codon:yes stop_codon:yes gene_type:complete
MLASIESKIKRAEKHIQILAQEIPEWSAKNPVRCNCVLNDGRLGFKLILNSFDEPFSLNEWALSAGECIHNLRSSLDNLVYALARIKQDPPKNPRVIKFPIYQDESQFNGQSKSTLDQLSDQSSDLIRKIQPFQRNNQNVEGKPEDDPLVLLNWLSNFDKHQIPINIHLPPNSIAHSAGVEYYSNEEASLNVPPDVVVWVDKLIPGTVLMEYRSKHPIKRVEGNFNLVTTVSIDIKGTLIPLLDVLPYLTNYTNLILNQFRLDFK